MPMFPRVRTAYRQLNRYRQIADVLGKYGFGQLLERIRLWEHTNIGRRIPFRIGRQPVQLPYAQRMRMALEELGPTFVKLGQLLSTRPDLLPQDLITELEKLQSGVDPVPTEVAKKVVQSELGRPIDEVFSSFEEQPVAAASLSQVHRATLKGGEVVAVKVQRPDIIKVIEADLEIMHSLATLMERYLDEARLLNVVGLVKEFSTDIRRELDFRTEANNLRRFAHNFAGNPQIHLPEVYHELCTRRLLVMEYIQGINISEKEKLAAEGYDLSLIAKRNVDILLKSTLEHGFFHADPHPGNVFVLPNNVICLLDFGMMGTLPSHDRDSLMKMISAIIKRDDKGLTKALLELTDSHTVANPEKLEMDVSNMITDFAYLPLNKLYLGDMIQQELQILRTHRLRFHTHLVWLLKAIATVETTARRMNPDFDMVQYVRPYAQRMLIGRLNPLRQAGELFSSLMDLLELVKELPYDTRDVLRKLKEGQVKIEFENVGLEPVTNTLNQVSNRIALAIVIAALVVGSSLIVLSGVHPLASGIPVIGLIGYGLAGLLSILFLISTLFRKK